MSVKVLIVLSLIAVAASTPAPAPTIPIKIGGNVETEVGIQIRSLDLGKGLQDLFGSLNGLKHTARNNLDNILNLKVSSFNEVCTLLSRVVVSLCDTIEASITGLGNLLSKVIISLLKIVICIIGGSSGKNPICASDVSLLVGVQASEATDALAVIKQFGLTDCKASLDNIISTYTRGQGVSVCRGSVSTIFNIAQNLVDRLQVVIDGSGSLGKADLNLCFRGITTLLGTIGNSRQNGLGSSIAKNFVNVCNKYIVKAGYPDFGAWKKIQSGIDAGNDDNSPWAVSDVDVSGNTGVSLSIGELIGNIFKGLLGVTRLAGNLIQDIGKIAINSVEDVLNLALKIVLGLGGLLDAIVSGLGSLLVRIVAGLLKIVVCFVGAGKYGVCQSSWERQVGVSGSVTSIDLVIKLYGLGNCRSQVDEYIKTYTNGAGIASTSGSVKILLQSCQTLADIVQNKKWNSDVVVTIFSHLSYMLGAVGNSNSKGVGTAVCNELIPACSKYLTAAGYPGLGDAKDAIINTAEQANGDHYLWTADIDTSDHKTGFIGGGSTSGNTSDNTSGNTSDNTSGNTSDNTSGNTSDNTSGNTSDNTSGNTSDNTSGNTSDNTSGNTSDNTSGNTSDNTSGNTSDNTSGNTSDNTSGNTSDNTSGNTSDNTSGNTNGNTGDNTSGNTGVSVGRGTGLIGNLVKGIFGTINGVTDLAIGALNSVLKITIGALSDVFNLIVSLSLVLEVILNNLVAGLGSLFVRLVACIIKIAVCVLGYPGDKGICDAGWNAKFGVNGEASTAADLLVLFRVDDAKTELNGCINTISNGKGISSTSGSVRTVLEQMNTLVTYTTNYKQISKQTVTDTFVIMATVSGSIGNSRQTNSGNQIVQKIVPECGKYFKQQGYADITVQVTAITKVCSSSNGDNVDWNGSNGNTQ